MEKVRYQFDSETTCVVYLTQICLVSEEEARYLLNGEDAVDQEKFVTDAWPNIKPYLMMDAGMFKPPAGEAEDMEADQEGEPSDADGESEGKILILSDYFILKSLHKRL